MASAALLMSLYRAQSSANSERNTMLKCYQTQFMIDVVDLTQLLIESGHLFHMHIIEHQAHRT